MLYDPKWEIGSLCSVIAWLEKQPPQESYQWIFPQHCLMGQYFRAMGVPEDDIRDRSLASTSEGSPLNKVALIDPFTFGAALKRARAALGR